MPRFLFPFHYFVAVKELILRYPVFALCEASTETVNVPSITLPSAIFEASNPETR